MELGFQADIDLVAVAGNLLDAFGADLLAIEVVHIVLHVPAKVAARLIFAKDNPVLVHKNFQRVLLVYPKRPAELHWDYHSAKPVNITYDSGRL
ncbi:hypothetical protein D3C74_382920 [compost metagenome]